MRTRHQPPSLITIDHDRYPDGAAMRLAAYLFSCVLALAAGQSKAQADFRVALVIGNAAYGAAPLLNPTNDAKAMATALKALGFRIIEVNDGSREQMRASIGELREALSGHQGVGLLYYAGHGLQLDWRNYMVPVDASLKTAGDVAAQAIDVQTVLDAFKAARTRMNIVVLDACRDNPFAKSASGKGLAPMDAPPGTLLAYATAPGNVAEDGTEGSANGLYTRYLAQEIKAPGARIEDVFKRVRFSVRQSSNGRQIPWESTSLEDDFYFDSGLKVAPVSVAQKQAALAKEMREWDRIRDSKDPNDFYAYLQEFPAGLISERAQFRLDQLQRAPVVSQQNASGTVALASGVNRYAVGDEYTVHRIDGFTKVATPLTRRVTSADDGHVEINGGELVLDQMGGVLRNEYGRKEPALVTSPGELSLGKRWRSAVVNIEADGTRTELFYDFNVVAFEPVTVPMGRYMAFKVERLGEGRGPGSYMTMKGTSWIDPTTMQILRSDEIMRRGGSIIVNTSFQLANQRRSAAR